MQIEEFLPPNQRAGGTLEFYNLDYEAVRLAYCLLAGWLILSRNHCLHPARTVLFSHNNQPEQYFSVLPNRPYSIAIVSLKKNFNAICPDDIFIKSAQNTSKKVVAIGRDAKFGLLMATSGEVKRGNKSCKLDCKDVQLSTCKIKKVLW